MTSNADRAAILVRALTAGVTGDSETLQQLCTQDVKAWTPALAGSSLSEVVAQLERRDDAFSNVELDVNPLDVGGDYACAEWTVTMTHTGRLSLSDHGVVEPTGLPITVNGVTVAEFRGEQICSVRQYWDELTVFEQLGLLHEEP
jgi:ketosteroid isomerase-like protein